ncbi:MAG: thioredoxin family protein [bacterium]|nr:thioredoxin family protein [Acidimicrobiia bacterium]MCY4650308.1 thioredoxin family protein [bacterium]
MVDTLSTMLPLGTPAPNFSLTDTVTGDTVSISDCDGKALVVMFICNHCPFVIHIQRGLVRFGDDYQGNDVSIVGISANDARNYPGDAPHKLAAMARKMGYAFPYLYDETQEVAKSYTAACTPDFFVFDADRTLVYRGQFDDARPSNRIPVTGADLRAAVDAVLADQEVSAVQKPSIGCNIKWIPGQEPDYFG